MKKRKSHLGFLRSRRERFDERTLAGEQTLTLTLIKRPEAAKLKQIAPRRCNWPRPSAVPTQC